MNFETLPHPPQFWSGNFPRSYWRLRTCAMVEWSLADQLSGQRARNCFSRRMAETINSFKRRRKRLICNHIPTDLPTNSTAINTRQNKVATRRRFRPLSCDWPASLLLSTVRQTGSVEPSNWASSVYAWDSALFPIFRASVEFHWSQDHAICCNRERNGYNPRFRYISLCEPIRWLKATLLKQVRESHTQLQTMKKN